MAVEFGPHVARSVVEPFVGRDKFSLGDPPSPKIIEPSVGRDGNVDIEDPCCRLTGARSRNPFTRSSAAVTVCELEASNRNPLAHNSAAVTVCGHANNQSSVGVTDKPKIKHKEAYVSGTPSIPPDIGDPCWQLFRLEHGIVPALAARSFADRLGTLHAEGPDKHGDEGHRPHRDPGLFGIWNVIVTRRAQSSTPSLVRQLSIKT